MSYLLNDWLRRCFLPMQELFGIVNQLPRGKIGQELITELSNRVIETKWTHAVSFIKPKRIIIGWDNQLNNDEKFKELLDDAKKNKLEIIHLDHYINYENSKFYNKIGR